MSSKQFDEFWEIRCPKCNEVINIEILANSVGLKKPTRKK